MRTVKLVNDKILMCTVLYEKKIFSISMCILLIMCYVNQIREPDKIEKNDMVHQSRILLHSLR